MKKTLTLIAITVILFGLLVGVFIRNTVDEARWKQETISAIMNVTPDFTSCNSLGGRDFVCVQKGTMNLRVTCYDSVNESLYCDSNPLVKLK